MGKNLLSSKLSEAKKSISSKIQETIDSKIPKFDFPLDINKKDYINVTDEKLLSSSTRFYFNLYSQNSKNNDKEVSDKISLAMLSYNSQKAINKVGTWSITIKDIFNDLNGSIMPGDWVIIFLAKDQPGISAWGWHKNDEVKGIRVIGMIDRVAQNKIIDNEGKISYTWTISGRDFGRVFEDTYVFFSPYTTDETSKKLTVMNLQLQIARETQDKSPDYFVKKYIGAILGGDKELSNYSYNLQIPKKLYNFLRKIKGKTDKSNGSTPFYGVLEKDIKKCMGTAIFKDILGNISYINLMNLIQDSLHLPFNEFIFDVVDNKPTFIFRPAAMSKEKLHQWAKNSQYTWMHNNIITGMNLGLSDHERINSIWLHGNLQGIGKALEYIAQSEKIDVKDSEKKSVDSFKKNILSFQEQKKNENPKDEMTREQDSINKYGFKKFEMVSDFIYNWNNKKGSFATDTYKKLLSILKDYLYVKHKYINGTITVQWYNQFQLGSWIRLDEPDLFLKIEEINEEWTYLTPIKTTLVVSHGFTTNGKFYTNVSEISSKNTSFQHWKKVE